MSKNSPGGIFVQTRENYKAYYETTRTSNPGVIMDIETTTTTATEAVEEFPTTTKTVLITVAATTVTLIGARLVLRRHFKKATEAPVVHLITDAPETPAEKQSA